MAYNHYQTNQTANPGWGTSQYRFGIPRAPTFQPQPSWGGADYYQNYAPGADPNLFQNAWDRVRQGSGGMGVGLHEARHWHRKAYGSEEVYSLSPAELGHAAAYEAYRSFIHHRGALVDPLGGDLERQRESLVGIAIGQVNELMSLRPLDPYGQTMVSEAAAATANALFWESREREEEQERRGRSRSMGRGSFGGSGSAYGGSGSASGYGGSIYDDNDQDDPYAIDDRRHRRRGRSHSRHRGYGGVASTTAAPMVIPGQVGGSAYGQQLGGSAYGSSYGQAAPYGGASTGYPSAPYGGGGGGAGVYGVGQSASYGQPVVSPTQYIPGATYGQPIQQGVPMVIPASRSGRSKSRHRSNSLSASQYGMPGYAPANGAQVVYVSPSSSHKHKHRKHSKRRSHSRY